MPTFNVPGADLHYETVGQGPVLLCIHGGDGSGEIWRGLSEQLKDRFTVVLYDRRGFSQSHLKGAQDYPNRLETDADDAALLLKHASPTAPATVMGNSSGAIVALKLLSRHPHLVLTLLAYEPPLARFLPDFDALYDSAQAVYDSYRSSGLGPGFAMFSDLIKADEATRALMRDVPTDDVKQNWNRMYWFEREFMAYPNAVFDVERELAPAKGRLVLVNGVRSDRGAYQFRANVALAGLLGLEVTLFPGEHVGHSTDAVEFGARLVRVLGERET